MADTLVVAWPGTGFERGVPTRISLEQIAAARGATPSSRIRFVALGPTSDLVARELGGAGIDEVIAVAADAGELGNDEYLDLLHRLVAERRPGVVVLANDPRGRELGPRLAARCGGAAINDVIAVRNEGGQTVWSRPCFGGKALADVAARRTPAVVTIRPRSFQAGAPNGESQPPTTTLERLANASTVVSEEVRVADRSGARLEDAKVIVAGGRGMGGQEMFDRLTELAAILGGTVGASLAAVDQGWARMEQQVGLTGKVVGAELYLAVGISGASQHIAGLAAVKTLVAINNDPSAPIFRVANLGAVLDAREAIPALIDELRRRGA
jgi:electron transfer flavoprotein alpha subunit